MNINESIEKAVTAFHAAEPESGTATLHFDKDFIGFAGHFPGHPILPGVCLVECGVELARRATKFPFHLTRIKQAKFFRPVEPGSDVDFSWTLELPPPVFMMSSISNTLLTCHATIAGEKVASLDCILQTPHA